MDEIQLRRKYYESLPDRTSPLLEKEIAMTFPGTGIPHEDQVKIIEAVKVGGIKTGGTYTPSSRGPCWQSLALRTYKKEGIPYPLHENIPNLGFHLRHLKTVPWQWVDTSITAMIQSYLAPVLDIFTHQTRVRAFLQVPGESITFHRDLSPGNSYYIENPYTNRLGPTKMKYLGMEVMNGYHFPDTDDHAKQNYFALKVPLTEIKDNYGPQTIVAEKPYMFTHGGDMYVMNEHCYHGVDAVPFYRGVIFVDGLISMEKLMQKNTGQLLIKSAYKFPSQAA